MKRLLVCLLALGLAGCSSTALRTATIPAQEPSVRYEPADTVRVRLLPLAEIRGMETEPFRVTSSPTVPPGLRLRVDRISVDRRASDDCASGIEIRVVYVARIANARSFRSDAYCGPERGEATVVEGRRTHPPPPDSAQAPHPIGAADEVFANATAAFVEGSPEDETVDARVEERDSRSWLGRKLDQVEAMFALIGIIATGFLLGYALGGPAKSIVGALLPS